jgi:hypothetical protein
MVIPFLQNSTFTGNISTQQNLFVGGDTTFSGNLTSIGDINTTSRYLSSGIDLEVIISNLSTGDEAVNTLVHNISGNWQDTYNTVSTLSTDWSTAYATTTSLNLSSANWNTAALIVQDLSGGYTNIYTAAGFNTIQEFATSNPNDIKKGYTVTLINNRVYIFAGTDASNPNHYLELNANTYTPIYQEIDLTQNRTLIDMFQLADFKTAKYTLQVESNLTNDIYFSELNVVASINTQTGVVTEYGVSSTLDLVLGYEVDVDVNIVSFYILHNTDDNIEHKLLVKGLRTNFYKI